MSQPGKPTVTNLTLTTAGTEYSYTIPEMTSKIQVKARTAVALQVSFTSSQSGTAYFTIPANQTYWDDDIRSSVTLYIQSGTNGTVAEILTWSGA